MKKHLLMALGAIAVVVGAAGCASKTDPYFDATIKHVDMGGESLSYGNLSTAMESCDNMLAYLGDAVAKRHHVKAAVTIAAKLLDLKSFKGYAESTVQVEPGLYVSKSFMLTDADSASIISGNAVQNIPLADIVKSLPADTRLAVFSNVNTPFVWTRINEEIAASGDKKIIQAMEGLKLKFKSKGLDLDAMAASASGPVMIVITGETPLTMKLMIGLPDRDSVISAALNKKFTPKAGESFYRITDLDFLPNARLVYAERSVLFVSDPAILEKPAKMYGETPQYAKFAAQLPKEGCGFIVADVSKIFAENANALIPKQYADFQLKPFCFMMVETLYEDGVGSVTVSDVSPQKVSAKFMESVFKVVVDQIVKPAAKKAVPAKKAK